MPSGNPAEIYDLAVAVLLQCFRRFGRRRHLLKFAVKLVEQVCEMAGDPKRPKNSLFSPRRLWPIFPKRRLFSLDEKACLFFPSSSSLSVVHIFSSFYNIVVEQ